MRIKLIGFNIPIYVEGSLDCIKKTIKSRKICGDGEFTKKCSELMEEKFNAKKILLTKHNRWSIKIDHLLCFPFLKNLV